jgi:NitT/TauT family transport system permease protein
MNSFSQPRTWERYAWPILTAGLLVAVWGLAVKWSGTAVFPAPLKVARGFQELVRKGLLFGYVGESLRRVATGYLAAAAVGIPAGLLLGWYPAAGRVVNPLIQLLRPISPIAWIPLAIVWFGVGEMTAVYLIFLGAVFPIVLAAMNGVQSVPQVFRRAGTNFGLSAFQVLAKVVFPAALPQMIVGLRIAFGVAWLVMVAAEMTAVDSGLGYLVIDSRNAGQRYDLVVAAILLIGLLGLALDRAFRGIERLKSVRWGFRHGS